MKSSYYLLSFLFLAVFVYCHPSPEDKDAMEACRTELGLTAEGRPDPKDPKTRCLGACICKKRGRMVGGKMIPEKLIAHVKEMHPDADESKIRECADEANKLSDECDVSHTAMKCLHDTFGPPKHGPHGPTTPAGFI
uniref:Odorant-binding protein 10 n=1 Tax=Encarsia formosa TaxID=32400 RepID=A0A514TTX2_ENCFO|nr:odorant-binding protein 10 [Encarsia formosa]